MGNSGLAGGIYLWINKANGKTYVGSSINLYPRISGYFSFNKLHGIIGNALRKYGLNGFILIIVFVRDATKEGVLFLEQSVLDNCVCDYNILPTAGSAAGFKLNEEQRAKVSAGLKGNTNRKDKGKAVYLYLVHVDRFELIATFTNMRRCAEHLGVPYATLFHRVNNRTVFKFNGLSHIVSRDGNLS